MVTKKCHMKVGSAFYPCSNNWKISIVLATLYRVCELEFEKNRVEKQVSLNGKSFSVGQRAELYGPV